MFPTDLIKSNNPLNKIEMNKQILTILIYLICLPFFAQNASNQKFNLMPWPQELTTGIGNFIISKDFTVNIVDKSNKNKRVYEAVTRFLRTLSNNTGIFIDQGFVYPDTNYDNPSLLISFDTTEEVRLGVDESYSLYITPKQIRINAKTDIGAMHGLNTLLQLILVENNHFTFPVLSINDSPRFEWRGLMLDVSRHFMPVDVVKRNLDAMAYVKMNVFHWHLYDDQGFRIESKKLPDLTLKGSDGLFYTQEQIKDIVKYADDRGIRVMPEIDVPGHGTAFATAYPEIASKDTIYELERYAGIFNPTLDPTNEKTYEVLETLFAEITPLFPDVYFHIGGDENEGHHWDENNDIQKFMKENNLKNNHELQTYFNIRLQKILKKQGKILMGWDEIMTENMPKDAIIHSWRIVKEGQDLKQIEVAKNGYKTVLSSGYYIDLMLPAKDHYLNDPIPQENQLSKEQESLIIGGEATMWSELVTPLTVDSRIWPRTAAIAERFWSSKKIRDVENMYLRLNEISNDLEQIGILHQRNKEVILRNITNYQDTRALNDLANVSEPFKIYTRNRGGKQYKSYSPFTLFADACNVDAIDAIKFNALCSEYLEKKSSESKNEILSYFEKWKNIESDLVKMAPKAPILFNILPYSQRVSKISVLLEKALKNGKLTKKEFDQVNELLDAKENPLTNLDVEFAVKDTLKRLALYLLK